MFKMKWGAMSAISLAMATFMAAVPATAAPVTLQVQNSGTAMLISKPDGMVEYQAPELDPGLEALEGTEADLAGMFKSGGKFANRSIAKAAGTGTATTSAKRAKSNPELSLTVDGLNLRQQRFANGGNQFTVEPPDQALCAGNGYVLEAVNDVLRVFNSSGVAVSGVVDLNSFYGYAPAITRTASPLFGPSITDPICHFDADTQRWFVVVLTLDRAIPTSPNLSGKNHLDIAVSTTANPLGAWRIYRLPVQNDGTDGTPAHADCPCIGDYPHIGMDANGLYLTTNEFPFAGGYNGAQIYAMSKRALAAGASSINVSLINTADARYLLDGAPGFTVWPALSPDASSFSTAQGGTEFMMSSQAVFNDSGEDNRIRVWALSNTASLDTPTPNVNLVHSVVTVDTYAVPGSITQKAGDYPQGQLAGRPLGLIDGNDSRMQQVSFANGKLWGALDTAVSVGGQQRVGIAYYAINPQFSSSGLRASVVKQGKLALAGNNLTRPAVAVLGNGRGVIGFSVVGPDFYPSAGYAGLDALAGAGEVHIASAGLGPQDGFSEYGGRPRWGDYGAAATDGKSIWLATEYIGQTCTVAQYVATAGSCGATRTSLANWGTRITKVTP